MSKPTDSGCNGALLRAPVLRFIDSQFGPLARGE
jgi:hypothetical protein